MYVLLVDHTDDYDPAEVHGPFESVTEAQKYAKDYRSMQRLPKEATPENNEEWTDLGWYFGIFEPTRFDRRD
jgi:hypothetical protein